MQQQLNGFDCGVYAIAYATDIAFDRDPASLSYGRQEMRIPKFQQKNQAW